MANLLTDGPILEAARTKATEILSEDPELAAIKNRGLKVYIDDASGA